jgi:1-acyl-sn-glycerol-3-phosphate acyltransferase
MSPYLLLPLLLWLLWALIAYVLTRNPRNEPVAGLTLAFLRFYALWFHRLSIRGGEHIPRSLHPGPLIVVCNHTAGVDPVLVQGAVRFEIRWMMARDMMPAFLAGLWKFTGVIPVNRAGADMTAARQALRYLAHGDPDNTQGHPGVIGIFPEGGIERPARTVLPFQPGVGLLIHKSKAPVLQVIIDGTPQTPTAWGSLFQRSTRVVSLRFLPIKHYRDSGLSAAAIADDLRARLITETGWPAVNTRSPETQH